METPAIRKQERELAAAKSTEVNYRTTQSSHHFYNGQNSSPLYVALQSIRVRCCENSEGSQYKHHKEMRQRYKI